MKRFIKGLLLMVFLLSMTYSVFAFGFARTFDQLPAPDLIEPHGETVNLTGKDSLEFKWWVIDLINVRFCEFRLYKGYAAGDNLIYKESVYAPSHSIEVKADLFEDGQNYTWVVYEVGSDGTKGDKSFSSFRAVKK
jgi:hypothetical protein